MPPHRPKVPPSGLGTEPSQIVDRIATYRLLASITDKDALHNVIATYGAQVLDKGLPYVLIAARNWQRSAHRRLAVHPEVPLTDISEPVSLWDPFEQLQQKESLRALANALSQLDDPEILVVWRHAEGHTDAEIQQEWDALGFEPRNPTEEYLRKRRQRARERLKVLLGR
jgi:hypothetical protein